MGDSHSPPDAPLDVGEPFRAALGLHPLLPFLELLLAEQRRRALRVDRLDGAAARRDGREHLELRRGENVREFDEFEAEARVGLVGAEAGHRLRIRHARERHRDVHAARFLENAAQQSLDERLDFLLGDEGSLDVDLRELRLPIRTQVLVAEAARDLEILLQPRDLQELLVLLRRLRQRVERARVQPRRHEEVARALGRRVREDRRLDFEEALLVEKVARRLHHAMAQPEVFLHRRGAQIEVAVLQAQILVHARVIERERRHFGLVQHAQRGGDDLDVARPQLRVLSARQARRHVSRDLKSHPRRAARGSARRPAQIPQAGKPPA